MKAVLLDRDGTLMQEMEYCRDPALVRLFPGVPEGLGSLKEAGFLNLLVTNQSGIGRGLITMAEYEAVHARLVELLAPASLDGVYMCPDAPDVGSVRRKPAPGMLVAAAAQRNLEMARCWMVGAKASDIECGRRVGCRTVLVLTGYGREQGETGADHVAADFPAAVEYILRQP